MNKKFDIADMGFENAPVSRSTIIAIIIYLSYFIILKYVSVGNIAVRIREPSSGGMGMRLNTARFIFMIAQ